MPAPSARRRCFAENATRLVRVAFSRWCVSLVLMATAGCQPTATVGVYTDVGVRCDPLGDACGAGRACSLRADPALDGCRDVDGTPAGEPCADVDACEAGAQCVAIGAAGASLDAADLALGVCARICARDAPSCGPSERCIGIIASGGGVRIDYGVCAP